MFHKFHFLCIFSKQWINKKYAEKKVTCLQIKLTLYQLSSLDHQTCHHHPSRKNRDQEAWKLWVLLGPVSQTSLDVLVARIVNWFGVRFLSASIDLTWCPVLSRLHVHGIWPYKERLIFKEWLVEVEYISKKLKFLS